MKKTNLNYFEIKEITIDKINQKYQKEMLELLSKAYAKAKYELDRDIYQLIESMAQDEGTDFLSAKRLLNELELKQWKMSMQQYEDNSKMYDMLSPNMQREVDRASYRMRISRIQAIQEHIDIQVDYLLNMEQKLLFDVLKKQYKNTYYHKVYDLQTIKGYSNLNAVSPRKLEYLLSEKWAIDEKNIPERILNRKAKVTNTIREELLQKNLQNRSTRETVKVVAERLDMSQRASSNLLRTESARVNSVATLQGFIDEGVEKFENSSVLDHKTSQICRWQDGKVYYVRDYKIGVTAPPFHSSCRTVAVAHYDDMWEYERASEFADGSRLKVDGKMDYYKWYDTYVK